MNSFVFTEENQEVIFKAYERFKKPMAPYSLEEVEEFVFSQFEKTLHLFQETGEELKNIKGWLYKVAKNRCLKLNDIYQDAIIIGEPTEINFSIAEDVGSTLGACESVMKMFSSEELKNEIKSALTDEEYSMISMLFFDELLSKNEDEETKLKIIASEHGVHRTTVYRWIRRALKKLQVHFTSLIENQ